MMWTLDRSALWYLSTAETESPRPAENTRTGTPAACSDCNILLVPSLETRNEPSWMLWMALWPHLWIRTSPDSDDRRQAQCRNQFLIRNFPGPHSPRGGRISCWPLKHQMLITDLYNAVTYSLHNLHFVGSEVKAVINNSSVVVSYLTAKIFV